MKVWANHGVSASRAFHHSDRLPWGSVSINRHRPGALALGLNGDMAGQGGLAGPALL